MHHVIIGSGKERRYDHPDNTSDGGAPWTDHPGSSRRTDKVVLYESDEAPKSSRCEPYRLALAPMEGLADDVLRDVLTRIGGYDFTVSEFVRISDSRLPLRSFKRVCPELFAGGRTSAGIPVRVQLLGSDPFMMAENAARLSTWAPPAIDLNFGCPAPTVNRHYAGAVLLDDPALIYRIAEAVCRNVNVPVTAKMRLGVTDTVKTLDCAAALESAGVQELVVHARTKAQMFRPPADWLWIARIAQAVRIPVIANGEIWSVDDYRHCRERSGVSDVMLGRGAVADPFLAWRIRSEVFNEFSPFSTGAWSELLPFIDLFWHKVTKKVQTRHRLGRLKLWLKYLARRFPEASQVIKSLHELKDPCNLIL